MGAKRQKVFCRCLRFLGAGPVLRGNSTEVHVPIDRRFSGWGLMRCSGFNRVGQGSYAQVAERLMAADCKSAGL